MDKDAQYNIKGADGREYGPISAEQARQWRAQGRLNENSAVRLEGTAEWKRLSDFPELSEPKSPSRPLPEAAPASAPAPAAAGEAVAPRLGLAITSLVLGVVSLVACLTLFAGIPAVICGHMAHRRARQLPQQYGGKGLATAGLVTGYLGIALGLLILSALLLPALAGAQQRAQAIDCANNLKQTGMAFKMWAGAHEDRFPFSVSTNQGGTLEFCQTGVDGFDMNAARHFLALSNELGSVRCLVCPAGPQLAATSFATLGAENVSYHLRTGNNITHTGPKTVLMVCPVDGNILYSDGSVEMQRRQRRSR